MEALLFTLLRPFFEAGGFTFLPGLKQFRRATDTGFQNVILAVTPAGTGEWVVETNLGTRLDMAERSAYPFTYGLRGFSEDSNTVITSVGRLQGKPHFRPTVTDANVQAMADELMRFMQTDGLPFLSQAAQTLVVHEWFNAQPHEPCPYTYNQHYRCFRGMAVAALVRPGVATSGEILNLDELAEKHRQALQNQQAPGDTLRRFENLVAYLRTFPAN
ncbi:MAG: hypothetical protein MUD08_00805 [Cytophagales bacterium]|nr:hypothetical protein [Cytophagales bacterium]